MRWPAEPVIARAYLDQLARAQALPDSLMAELDAALVAAASLLENGGSDDALSGRLASLADTLQGRAGDAVTLKRLNGLADTLTGLAARL